MRETTAPRYAESRVGDVTTDPAVSGARIGSLCSGYGGLDLGLISVVGGTVAWHVENAKHPSTVLEARFPSVPNYGDVKATDWSSVEPVDWLTAGYPCQPFSDAGLRLGEADERHLWPYVAGAIRALRPRNVLLENVRGHLRRGFGTVLGDLATIGYDTQWVCLRASDAGAPHGRARVFIVATDTTGPRRLGAEDTGADRRDAQPRIRCAEPERDGGPRVEWGGYALAVSRWERLTGRRAPRPVVPGPNGVRLNPRFVEWMQGLPNGWVTDILTRHPALTCLGNGVVPQQAALALRTLLNLESQVAA